MTEKQCKRLADISPENFCIDGLVLFWSPHETEDCKQFVVWRDGCETVFTMACFWWMLQSMRERLLDDPPSVGTNVPECKWLLNRLSLEWFQADEANIIDAYVQWRSEGFKIEKRKPSGD